MHWTNGYCRNISDGKESDCNAGDLGSIPGLRRCPGEGNGNPRQDSCLENPLDKGSWQAIVHVVTQSWTQLSNEHPIFLKKVKTMELKRAVCQYNEGRTEGTWMLLEAGQGHK